MTADEFERYERSLTLLFEPPMHKGRPITVDGTSARWSGTH